MAKHFTSAFKTKCVSLVARGVSRKEVAERYGCSVGSLQNWISAERLIKPKQEIKPTETTIAVVPRDLTPMILTLKAENSRLKVALADLYIQHRSLS